MPRPKPVQTDAGVPIKLQRCLRSSFYDSADLKSSSDMDDMRREKLLSTKIIMSAQRPKPEIRVLPPNQAAITGNLTSDLVTPRS